MGSGRGLLWLHRRSTPATGGFGPFWAGCDCFRLEPTANVGTDAAAQDAAWKFDEPANPSACRCGRGDCRVHRTLPIAGGGPTLLPPATTGALGRQRPLPFRTGGYAHSRPYECDRYARDNAHHFVPQGASVGRGAVRGAVGGAVFGAIVGGSKGARRGVLAGGGLGAVAAGARSQQEREYVRQLAYDDCMLGFRR